MSFQIQFLCMASWANSIFFIALGQPTPCDWKWKNRNCIEAWWIELLHSLRECLSMTCSATYRVFKLNLTVCIKKKEKTIPNTKSKNIDSIMAERYQFSQRSWSSLSTTASRQLWNQSDMFPTVSLGRSSIILILSTSLVLQAEQLVSFWNISQIWDYNWQN